MATATHPIDATIGARAWRCRIDVFIGETIVMSGVGADATAAAESALETMRDQGAGC